MLRHAPQAKHDAKVEDTTAIELHLAPGRLRLVHEFLNALDAEPSADRLAMGESIRRRHARGESQSALAKAYGISQPLVSAILGGRRLAARGPEPTGGLGSPEEAHVWLAARGLSDLAGELNDGEVERLRDLKAVLRALVFANNGQPLDPAVLERLDGLAASAPLVGRFATPHAPVLNPAGPGIAGVAGAILAAVMEAMYAGTWTRLKSCPGADCRWVFYDLSPKASRTWCWMAVCGNRAKVRNYQERRRTARGAAAVQP